VIVYVWEIKLSRGNEWPKPISFLDLVAIEFNFFLQLDKVSIKWNSKLAGELSVKQSCVIHVYMNGNFEMNYYFVLQSQFWNSLFMVKYFLL